LNVKLVVRKQWVVQGVVTTLP
jgi:hypothetical protein